MNLSNLYTYYNRLWLCILTGFWYQKYHNKLESAFAHLIMVTISFISYLLAINSNGILLIEIYFGIIFLYFKHIFIIKTKFYVTFSLKLWNTICSLEIILYVKTTFSNSFMKTGNRLMGLAFFNWFAIIGAVEVGITSAHACFLRWYYISSL